MVREFKLLQLIGRYLNEKISSLGFAFIFHSEKVEKYRRLLYKMRI